MSGPVFLRRKWIYQTHFSLQQHQYHFLKVYCSAVSGFLKNCDGNFLIGDDLQLYCWWAWHQCCHCCVRWCGVRLIGKGRCRYSWKRFEIALARWHSGWITQVNIEGTLVPRVYQDSDPYAPTLWSLIHRCESRAWDGKTIQVYWGLQDFLFFLTKLFYKHFFLFSFNFLSDMPHTQ